MFCFSPFTMREFDVGSFQLRHNLPIRPACIRDHAAPVASSIAECFHPRRRKYPEANFPLRRSVAAACLLRAQAADCRVCW
jgi:hypothetical protein